MELVTLVEIELLRPTSVQKGYSASPSNGRSGIFIVDDEELDTLKEAVLDFAGRCGVDRTYLQGLRHVSSRQYDNDDKVIIFDVETPGIQYGRPYAACRADPALKVGTRYFKLCEISNVIEAKSQT